MKKIYYIFVLVFIFSCKETKNEKNINLNETFKISLKDSLINELKNLQKCNLNFKDLYATYQSSTKDYENYLRKDEFQWFYNQFSDTLRFDRVDDLKPICMYYQNKKFISILFSDSYDYKMALHIINFENESFKPISSFILFSVGGDAEDFWETKVKRINQFEFETTENVGRFNNLETQDTIFVGNQITKKIKIDSNTGKISKKIISESKNLIELK